MKKVLKLGLPLGVAALSMASFSTYADLRFNGFASFVVGQNLEDDVDNYAGYDDDLSFRNESLFALQAIADLGDGLSATAQIVSRGSDDFDTKFAWAYLSYELSDYTTFRAGRLRLPFYLYSDFLDVGYAYPWVRPSTAMYNLPFSNYDGVSVLHNKLIGDWDVTFNVVAGELEDTFFADSSPTRGSLSNMIGLSTSFSREWFSGYFTYIVGEVDIPVAEVESFANLATALGASEAAANELRMDGDTGTFFGAGFNIDYDKFSIIGEYSINNTEDSFRQEDIKAGYLSFGYRVNFSFMPYVSVESYEVDANTSVAAGMPNVIIPALGTQFDGLPLQAATSAIVNGIQQDEYSITSVGFRYDFHPAAAFKVQYSSVDNDLNDFYDAELISAGVDIVF